MKVNLTIDKNQKTLTFEGNILFCDLILLNELFDVEKIGDWKVDIKKSKTNYEYSCDIPPTLIFEN